MWRFLVTAIAVLICGYAADAQEKKKPAVYSVKAVDCKTAANCRVECKEPNHVLVIAICTKEKKEKGKFELAKYSDGKRKASCPAPANLPMFGVCLERPTDASPKKKP